MTTQDPLAPIQDTPGLPRVLLLGDSISVGYTLPVRELLNGKANIHRPPDNCSATRHGLDGIDRWLGDGSWDVIHFNWGLHDLAFVDDQGKRTVEQTGRHQVPIDQYETNLNTLVERLKQTGAALIWCTTTPVPDGAAGRKKGDEVLYNAAAKNIMNTHGIPINDLNEFALARIADIQMPADVHFTDEGSAELAEIVANHILEALGER